jgi:hypothetical protein
LVIIQTWESEIQTTTSMKSIILLSLALLALVSSEGVAFNFADGGDYFISGVLSTSTNQTGVQGPMSDPAPTYWAQQASTQSAVQSLGIPGGTYWYFPTISYALRCKIDNGN